MNKLLFTAILLSLFTSAFALDNGLALTPAMGWNSWNKFACEIDENLIKKTADALVDTGLRDLGYVYLNLDDCWQISRDKQGNIVADPRFPSGMKALGDYIHGKGLRFGVYSDAGSMTCQKRFVSIFGSRTKKTRAKRFLFFVQAWLAPLRSARREFICLVGRRLSEVCDLL